jgi:hypothetical protein
VRIVAACILAMTALPLSAGPVRLWRISEIENAPLLAVATVQGVQVNGASSAARLNVLRACSKPTQSSLTIDALVGRLRYCDLAAASLEGVSGQHFGISCQAPVAERDQAVAAASAWLTKQGAAARF